MTQYTNELLAIATTTIQILQNACNEQDSVKRLQQVSDAMSEYYDNSDKAFKKYYGDGGENEDSIQS